MEMGGGNDFIMDENWPDVQKRKEVAAVYGELARNTVGISGATVEPCDSEHLFVSLNVTQTDLNRLSEVQSSRKFLVSPGKDGVVVEVGSVPVQSLKSQAEMTCPSGNRAIKFVAGDKEELWAEVWEKETGLRTSLSVGSTLTRVYNNSAFGGIVWNSTETKCCFIGEVPAPKKFRSYFDGNQANSKEGSSDGAWAEQEFEFSEDFGETLEKLVRPAIFVLDTEAKSVKQVEWQCEDDDIYPQNPLFDENDGIVCQGIELPGQKLGLSFCLNKPTALYHIAVPKFKGENAPGNHSQDTSGSLAVRLTPKEFFLAFNPIFSTDFTKLAFFGRAEAFVSHSATYALYYMDWRANRKSPICAVERVKSYPATRTEFAGFYGYQSTYVPQSFLGNGSRFMLTQSFVKGHSRIYLVDLGNNSIKRLDLLQTDCGEEEILKVYRNTFVFKTWTYNQPARAYFAVFNQEEQSFVVTELFSAAKTFLAPSLRSSVIDGVEQKVVVLDNGSEGFLQFNRKDLQNSSKLPCVVIIHGGPFSAAQQEAFLLSRNMYIALGYSIFIINYRGSCGYGEDFLDSLVGNIGDYDVHDCGRLVRQLIEECGDIVNAERIAVYGGSHGGFLTGWLVGHPDYKDLFKCAILWNPVLNVSYNVQATDIPDWCYACALGKPFSPLSYTKEANDEFFRRSPMSVVGNVRCPCMFLIGASDLRVPKHQSQYFYHTLKSQGVDTKLFMYPNCGHAIAPCKENVNANMNILFWLARNL